MIIYYIIMFTKIIPQHVKRTAYHKPMTYVNEMKILEPSMKPISAFRVMDEQGRIINEEPKVLQNDKQF